MLWLVNLMMFLIGLCVGSFINMLVYRTAVRYKLIKSLKSKSLNKENRSFCDFCGRQLHWYENIPVFSWVIQKGKTRCCDKSLPYSYPIVELGTGIIFLIYDLRFMRYEWTLLIGLVVLTLLAFLMIFDFKYMILPDFAVVILIVVASLGVIFDEKNIIPYILSAMGASGFLLILNLLTKGRGMGMGDVKLAVFMGFFLGFPKIIVAFYVAFIVGAIVGLGLLISGKVKKGGQIAFGPYLILGTVTAWWWGDWIVKMLEARF